MASRKRPSSQFSTNVVLKIAEQLLPQATITNGAVEGLRISIVSLLNRLAQEFADLDHVLVTNEDVVAAMTKLGLSDFAQDALSQTQQPKKRRKKKKWDATLVEDQEKLLAQTMKDMEKKSEQGDSKSII